MFESKRHSKSLFLEQTFPNPLISFDRLYTHNVYHQSATKPLKEVWGNSKKVQEASRNKTALPLQSLFEAITIRGTLSTERKNNPVEETRKNTPYMTPQQLPCIIYVQSP